jgi:hypothetical protein
MGVITTKTRRNLDLNHVLIETSCEDLFFLFFFFHQKTFAIFSKFNAKKKKIPAKFPFLANFEIQKPQAGRHLYIKKSSCGIQIIYSTQFYHN